MRRMWELNEPILRYVYPTDVARRQRRRGAAAGAAAAAGNAAAQVHAGGRVCVCVCGLGGSCLCVLGEERAGLGRQTTYFAAGAAGDAAFCLLGGLERARGGGLCCLPACVPVRLPARPPHCQPHAGPASPSLPLPPPPSSLPARCPGPAPPQRAGGYRQFFLRAVPVAPNRFRPANHVGDAVYEHAQNTLLIKVG